MLQSSLLRLVFQLLMAAFASAATLFAGFQEDAAPDRSTAASPVEPAGRVEQAGTVEPAGGWNLEILELRDGTVYRGLRQSVGPQEVEFVQIVQKPGRPMSALVRVIDRARIARFAALPEDQRVELQDRFRWFRNRAAIQAGRMENVVLAKHSEGGVPQFTYRGDWFQLHSTADEESTRRCVVRIEQIFRAYRQLLPPRVEAQRPLRVVLFGSIDEYHTRLRRWNLDIPNLAFYSATNNMIVAGSDLAGYSRQLAQIRVEHDELLMEFESLRAEFLRKLASVSEAMKERGFRRDEIQSEMTLRRAAWKSRHSREIRRVSEANRRNDALFAVVTQQMFHTLYHEAFHAYLENFVFPRRSYDVDRWLNEGLAQVFETGRIEADALRVDAPHRDALALLQRELAAGRAMPLAELLTASDASFYARHASSASDRRYAYAWGLAYFLTFRRSLLENAGLEVYVSSPNEVPIARFERLAGMKLEEFEAQWRAAMASLGRRDAAEQTSAP